jgi:hypothetical protein
MYTQTHLLHNTETAGQTNKMKKEIGSATNVAFKGNFSARHFGHVRSRFFSLDPGFAKFGYKLYG